MNRWKRSGSLQGGVSSRTSWPRRARSSAAAVSARDALGIDRNVDRRGGGDRDAERRWRLGRSSRRTAAREEQPTTDRRARSPARTSRKCAASSTVRAIGPAVERPSSEPNGALDTRPRDGFSPKRPQHDAGIRIDPPPSVACAIGTRPAETAAAAPPLDPPGVRSVSHGLRVAPLSSDSVNATVPNSGRVRLSDDHEPGLADPAYDGACRSPARTRRRRLTSRWCGCRPLRRGL